MNSFLQSYLENYENLCKIVKTCHNLNDMIIIWKLIPIEIGKKLLTMLKSMKKFKSLDFSISMDSELH